MNAVFTFDTTHHALWAEQIASDIGAAAHIVQAPPAARARCSLALEVLEHDAARMERELTMRGVPHLRYRPASVEGPET